jgi:hypothetical protein
MHAFLVVNGLQAAHTVEDFFFFFFVLDTVSFLAIDGGCTKVTVLVSFAGSCSISSVYVS